MVCWNFLIALAIAVLIPSTKTVAMIMRSCSRNSQCGENQCCALRLKILGYKGYCLRTKTLGELCSPKVKAGKHFTCGCSVGLTCAITAVDVYRNPKYRCVRIPTETPEISEKSHSSIAVNSQGSPYELMFSTYFKNRLNRLRNENRLRNSLKRPLS